MDLYHETTRYFGLSELLELTNSGSGLPLMRYDSSFETMATALEEKCVEVRTLTLRCPSFKVKRKVPTSSPPTPHPPSPRQVSEAAQCDHSHHGFDPALLRGADGGVRPGQ